MSVSGSNATKKKNLALNTLQKFWCAGDGPLTQELVQSPGAFGLGQLPTSLQPDATTRVVCGYCSTGCGLNVHLREGEAINLTPAVDYPVNAGMACPKGWEALTAVRSPGRGVAPLLRDKRGKVQTVDWQTAATEFCNRIKQLQKQHGPESVAFLSTGQMTTEEMAYLGALTKFGMGLKHGDGNTRQCMATAVVAYKQAFGFDAPPYTYQDFEESDVIVLVGSNLCIAHPIMWQRVLANGHDPEIIVIDPRRTETAMAATQHLAIQPKSDLVLFYGIANLLIENGWIDEDFIRAHTTGFDEFRQHACEFPLPRTAAATGLSEEQITSFAQSIHQGRRVSFWWTMGVNQSYEGVRAAQAIINLALMPGNIGKPGTRAKSITGQCNAMGSRLFSNTSNLLGGHDFGNENHRRKVADILRIDAGRIPTDAGWNYNGIMEGILRGDIRALWVVCTNTAHSWINQNAARDILSRLDFLVVQDMYPDTETAQMADLYLPAAGWGEKEGTFINSERRIGLVKKVSRAPGQALADFSIFRLIAQRWGCGDMFADWNTPEAVFQTMKQLSQGQPCDITGIDSYTMLDEAGGIQWPYPAPTSPAEDNAAHSPAGNIEQQQRRLFEDGQFYHADGRAKFLYAQTSEMPEPPNARFPFLLLTGRGTAAQWHTQTRTARSAVLRNLAPESIYVEINPLDARREGILPNQPVLVESQRGRLTATAVLTPVVQPGQVFMAMHYEATNQLTLAHFDPYSHQPSYKNCAVRVRKAEPWEQL